HLDVAHDGRTLLATASDLGQSPLFSIDPVSGRVSRLSGDGTVGEFSPAARGSVINWHDLATPPDLYLLNGKGQGGKDDRRRLTKAKPRLLGPGRLGACGQ